MKFCQQLVDRAAANEKNNEITINASVIGMPLREAHTGISVTTCMELAYRHLSDNDGHDERDAEINGLWMPLSISHEDMESDQEREEREEKKELLDGACHSFPRVRVTLWVCGDSNDLISEKDLQEWTRISDTIRATIPEAEVCLYQ